jgi:hypothetical protein
MSMDFSEFLRRLGADPDDQDPEFVSARQSGAEFERAAVEAEAFEQQLKRATRLPAPDGLLDQILKISRESGRAPASGRRWRHLALAAGLVLAVGAAGITWNLNRSWESVDEYVMDHYRHDGEAMLLRTDAVSEQTIREFFTQFDVTATPGLTDIISVIKYCPTPDGTGVHMVLNTSEGLVTVIYMPATGVTDHQRMAFDNMNALYVSLEKGSAIIISPQQESESLYALVQQSIIPNRG